MAHNDFEPWLEQTASQPGVLACGVKASQSTAVASSDASYPEARVKELMQAFSEVGLTLRQDHLVSGRCRWVFENGQIHSVRRQDGALALLILANDSTVLPTADSALAQFISIRATTTGHSTEVLTALAGESAASNGHHKEAVTAAADETATDIILPGS